MNKFKQISKIFIFLISFIIILNQLSILTNTIIHTYLLIFVIILYLLTKLKYLNQHDLFKFSLKDLKITFILCSIVIIFQIFSFNFIYPALYSSINMYFKNIILGIIMFQLLNCTVEEIFFRGYVFSLLNKSFNDKECLLISSIIFALYHIIMYSKLSITINESIMVIIFTGSVGLCLGYIYLKSNNLLPCILIHSVYNICQNIINIDFDIHSFEIQNLYIQYTYPTFIFLVIYLVYSKLYLKNNPINSIEKDIHI